MSECKCDFRTYMVGDGCEVCNPAKALEYAKETIADQELEIDSLRAEISMLRTGDTCARRCEGTAYRIEAQSQKRVISAQAAENKRLTACLRYEQRRSEPALCSAAGG